MRPLLLQLASFVSLNKSICKYIVSKDILLESLLKKLHKKRSDLNFKTQNKPKIKNKQRRVWLKKNLSVTLYITKQTNELKKMFCFHPTILMFGNSARSLRQLHHFLNLCFCKLFYIYMYVKKKKTEDILLNCCQKCLFEGGSNLFIFAKSSCFLILLKLLLHGLWN